MARLFTSVSVETTLSATISSSATSITVANATALLGDITIGAGDQFTVAIDPDTASEEIVFVTAANTSTNTLTVTRGRAGTSAITHASGAQVKHVLTSSDLTAFEATTNTAITAASTSTLTNKTISASNNTLTGVVTPSSTDTLTNKNLTSGTNTFPTSLVTTTGTQTLTNKTIDYNSNTISNLPTGSLTLLTSTTLATGSTTATVSTGYAAPTYKGIAIELYNANATAAAEWRLYIGNSTNSNATTIVNYGNGTDTGIASKDYIALTGFVSGTAKKKKASNNDNYWWIQIIDTSASGIITSRNAISFSGTYKQDDDAWGTVFGGGATPYPSSAPVTVGNITFQVSAGTISNGTVNIYGIK